MKAFWQAVGRRTGLAFERWSYDEGYTAGRIDGVRVGFADGYRARFDAGAIIGVARLLLAVEHGLGHRLLELLPQLPHTGHHLAYRHETQLSNQPCVEGCGAGSRCIRASAVRANLAPCGAPDYPGTVPNRSGGRRP